eukprot:3876735-Pyramimonas_sp.AAC.1
MFPLLPGMDIAGSGGLGSGGVRSAFEVRVAFASHLQAAVLQIQSSTRPTWTHWAIARLPSTVQTIR